MDSSSIIALSVALGHSIPEAAYLQLEVERLRAEVAELHALVGEWAAHSAMLEYTLETAERACSDALDALQRPDPQVVLATFLLDDLLDAPTADVLGETHE